MATQPSALKPTMIFTHTGKTVDLANPRVEDIDIRDIAHSLARFNRFTGHTNRDYSVGEHSLLVCRFASLPYALEALLHDATEAYLGDVSSPLKSMLPEYQDLEGRWSAVINQKFSLRRMNTEIKSLDAAALRAEMEELLLVNTYSDGTTAVNSQIVADMRSLLHTGYENSADVKASFLRVFYELMTARYMSEIAMRESVGP